MSGNCTARTRSAVAAGGRSSTEGRITRIQRFSTHDGPGIRTTVFFKGCPLRCRWCHNPETITSVSEILFFAERCRHCGSCVAACPEGAHRLTAGGGAADSVPADGAAADSVLADGAAAARHEFDRSRCRLHYACVAACPFGALEASLQRTSVGRVLEAVLKDAAYYRNSGGGLTLSGGEPLLQPEFARDLLTEARGRGVHTALDTCLYAPWETVESLAEAVDLWLVDLKMVDPGRHELYTGVSNALILENLRRLAALRGVRLWIRLPLVEGVNTEAENLEATVTLIAGLGSVAAVELLPYHALGVDKRKALGERSPEQFAAPAPRVVEALAARLEERGLAVRYRGTQRGESA